MRSRLREWRVLRGMTQQQLADRAGISRQTVGGLESGQYGPGVDVALRLARTLACTVEELFALSDEEQLLPLRGRAPTAVPYRVALAEIGGVLLARPLQGLGQPAPADGIAAGEGGEGLVRIAPLPGAGRNLFVAGCDPALGLLCGHVERAPSHVGARWWNAGNGEARAQLRRGEVHAAAIHGPTGPPSAPDIDGIARFRVGNWQLGFITAAGNPKALTGPHDLARVDVRLVNREVGSGARDLLDRILAELGIATQRVQGYSDEVQGHLEVAAAVALGAADVGIGHAAAAAERGLGFLPLAEEACDLLLSLEFLQQREGLALIDALGSAAFRRDLSAFGPYDTTRTGDRIV